MNLIDKDALLRYLTDQQMSCAANDRPKVNEYDLLAKICKLVENIPVVESSSQISTKDKSPEKNVNCIPLDDFGAVCNCAIRYCLGRRSYMPALVIDFIAPHVRHLTDKTIWCLKSDIERYKESGGDFGYDFDEKKWMEFLNLINKEYDRRNNIDYDEDLDDVIVHCPMCDGNPVVKNVDEDAFVCVCSNCGWTPFKNNESTFAKHMAKSIWNRRCKSVIELRKISGKM